MYVTNGICFIKLLKNIWGENIKSKKEMLYSKWMNMLLMEGDIFEWKQKNVETGVKLRKICTEVFFFLWKLFFYVRIAFDFLQKKKYFPLNASKQMHCKISKMFMLFAVYKNVMLKYSSDSFLRSFMMIMVIKGIFINLKWHEKKSIKCFEKQSLIWWTGSQGTILQSEKIFINWWCYMCVSHL